MSSGLADVEYGVEVCSLSAGSQHCPHASLKLGNLCRNRIVGGVGKPGVEIAVLLQVEKESHLFTVVVLESGALDDRQFDRLAVTGFIASLHAQGSGLELVVHCLSVIF